MTRKKGRRWLVPEVIQTSAMDCGPASLKCLLEGFGIRASYGRLREACQTEVDGTSIDTLEGIAVQLGLEAEQVMVPARHLLLASADALPAIVVVVLPNGFTHFVVVWNRHGPLVQVMDPAEGRSWMTRERFLERLYIHTHPIPAETYRTWAASDDFLGPYCERLSRIGAKGAIAPLMDAAVSDPSWRASAALDATTAMVEGLVASGGIARGTEAAQAIDHFFAEWKKSRDDAAIPAAYWTARPPDPAIEGTEEQVLFRGAVAVRVEARPSHPVPAEIGAISPELAQSLREPQARPGAELFRLLGNGGRSLLLGLVASIVLSAICTVLEAILLRGLFDLGRVLVLFRQRILAIAALVVFMILMAALELPIAQSVKRLGRQLETRLRVTFLEKVPRLGDRYFQSRPISDMAERSHAVHRIRELPELAVEVLRGGIELVVTPAALAWLDPHVGIVAAFGSVLAVGISIALLPWMNERDLRLRSHSGALARFYLDALQGLVAIRSHGAETVVSSEHEGLLVEWVRTARSLVGTVVFGEVLQALAGLLVTAFIVFEHVRRAADPSSTLLVIFWTLSIPVAAERFAMALRQYPAHRNVTLRLLEPLGALDETDGIPVDRSGAGKRTQATRGMAVSMREVGVVAGGHPILQEIDLEIAAGEHVAIVGPSGSGKSSLVGLLLGWHRAVSGSLAIDGADLDGPARDRIRRETAWVDPGVRLWNCSLVENLHYGNEAPSTDLAWIIEAAELRALLERLPDGMQTSLGEGGALVSGGEGQRVRLGRAMVRRDVRLVILDEPFRGLDRKKRRALLARARELWKDVTLLCITHDVDETLTFDRALVMDAGKIVEDGVPAELAKAGASRYADMLDVENAVRASWISGSWRRLALERGRLEAAGSEDAT